MGPDEPEAQSRRTRVTMYPALRSGQRSLALALGLAGLAGTSACDSSATIYVSTPQFQTAQIVSAYPARKQADGSWDPVCGTGQADGIITNVVYLSSLRRSSDDQTSSSDLDVSVRPGDVIDARVVDGKLPDDINLSSPGNFNFQFDCIKPASAASADCTGGTVPAATLERSEYVANTPSRDRGHNVLLLIDQSGSVGGIVQDQTWKEQRTPNPFPENFGPHASDQTSLRGATATRLIRALNSNDRFGAMAFNEAIDRKVPCSDAIGDVAADLDTCFGARNLDIWTTGINQLQSSTEGRSNLWRAVETGYTFLRSKNDNQRSNHIIVITDGPDTCQGENRLSCESACTTANYDQLVEQIGNDANDPNAAKIHIHFIQFESEGYRGRDPRQVEVACTSRGHYQFINSEDFAQAGPFQQALEVAITNVRNSFMGHWELASSVPAYTSNASAGGVPAGNLYGLSGALVVRSTSNLVGQDTTYPFGFGVGAGAAEARNWDRRLTVRKPCDGFASCGAGGDASACSVVCSPETMICANGANPVQLPNLTSCDGGGFCCTGECRPSGSCEACPQ